MKALKFVPVLIALLMLSGCFTEKQNQIADSGEGLYNRYCADCHKETGQGNFIRGIPANAKTALSKDQIVALITSGMASHKGMPTFPQMSKEQAAHIADHLLALRQ